MKKTLLIVSILVFAIILTFCSKSSTSTEEGLNAPSNLELTLVGSNLVKLAWQDNSTEAIEFMIDRKEGEFDWYENYAEVESNITSFIDNIPTESNTVYSYRVRSFDGSDYSDYSIPAGWFSDSTVPTDLQLEQVAQDSIRLCWLDNSIGELNFRIDRKIGSAEWQEGYKILESETTIYIDYNTSYYDACYYRVFAASGNSLSNYNQNSIVPSQLLAPSNLEIEALSLTSIKLTWDDNCEVEDGYLLCKMEEGCDWDSIYVAADTEEWLDEEVTPGIMNYYKVCAYINSNYSQYIEGSVSTFPAPLNLTATFVDSIVILVWQDNNNYEEGFVIERKVDEGDYEEIATVGQDMTTYIDENVEMGIIYFYRVYAFAQGYQSEYSNEILILCTLDISLTSFTVQYVDSYPTLFWTTQWETNNMGWNIYRGESCYAFENDETFTINSSLIPGAGTTSEPTDYTFQDEYPVVENNTYWYWLESVDGGGDTQIFGPISLTIPNQ